MKRTVNRQMRWLVASLGFPAAVLAGCGGSSSAPGVRHDANVAEMGARDAVAEAPRSCDLALQDCGSGMKCTLYLANRDAGILMPGCVSDGTVAEGGSCMTNASSVDDCVHGTFCRQTGGSGTLGVCAKFCSNGMDSECALQPQGLCDLGVPGSLPMAYVCEYPRTCNPFGGTAGCPSGDGCYWYPAKSAGLCFAAGTVATGGACTYLSDCAPGSICLSNPPSDAGPAASCYAVCASGSDAGGPSCAAGKTCSSLGTPPVGYCH